ncbi:hypothetical protein T492DRAFT_846919 [Pavlovales sp. CCMP2436]|nr:hypothetical protein T492DRAFT_846919 [Pavlovales sp. CCMP2436]
MVERPLGVSRRAGQRYASPNITHGRRTCGSPAASCLPELAAAATFGAGLAPSTEAESRSGSGSAPEAEPLESESASSGPAAPPRPLAPPRTPLPRTLSKHSPSIARLEMVARATPARRGYGGTRPRLRPLRMNMGALRRRARATPRARRAPSDTSSPRGRPAY